jgi:hypothetical protein
MSDGPHKSLAMRPAWKRLAERADNSAFAPEEVRDALPAALQQDWNAEVSGPFLRQLQDILGDSDSGLFGDRRIDRLDALRLEAAGFPLAGVVLDCAIQAISQGRSSDDLLTEAGVHALADRAARGARQIEEHYMRTSSHDRADCVRERLEAGVTQVDMRSLAQTLVRSGHGLRTHAPAKRDALDDGVRL